MSEGLVQTQSGQASQDTLATAGDRLQEALVGGVPGRERDWAEGVARALVQVERELRRHQASAQAPDGPFASLDQMRPTLFRQWSILCLHYRDLLKRVQRLRTEAERACEAFQPGCFPSGAAASPSGSRGGAVPVFGTIRQQVKDVLADLTKSREAETALLLDSVVTDIGVGD